MFLGEFADQRRRMDAFGSSSSRWSSLRGCAGGRSWFCRGRSLSLWRWCGGFGGRSSLGWTCAEAARAAARAIDHRNDGLDGNGLAFSNLDFLQHTGGRRGNFGVDLVGGDFEQRLVALDLVTGLLEPLGDGAFENAFAHLGHDYIHCHGMFLLASGNSRRCGRPGRTRPVREAD